MLTSVFEPAGKRHFAAAPSHGYSRRGRGGGGLSVRSSKTHGMVVVLDLNVILTKAGG